MADPAEPAGEPSRSIGPRLATPASGEPFTVRIRSHAAERPNASALQVGDLGRTWQQLERRTREIAQDLAARGIGPGHRVALLCDPVVEFPESLLGVIAAGASVVPLPGGQPPAVIASLLGDCGARLLAVSAGQQALAEQALAHCDVEHRVSLDFEAGRWRGWRTASSGPALPPPDLSREANLIYSSGTTGRPKGIVQSQAVRVAHAQAFEATGLGPASVMVLSTTHYSNWTLSGLLSALYAGARVAFAYPFDPTGFLSVARDVGATHALFVPVQLERLLVLEQFHERIRGLPLMKLCAGAPLPARIKRRLLNEWPGGLIENYGLTEGAPSTLLIAARFPDKLDSVGQALAGGEIRIIDEGGRELPVGVVGEIVGRTGAMMSGYHNLPAQSREIEWLDSRGTRFFRSGDLGYLDQDGFLYIAGRAKDVIISGGANVYPSDIEGVIAGHPDVAEVAVIGIPSERWGETPLALVVPRSRGGSSPGELMAWANVRLGKTQRLAALEFRESLPRGALDKVLKNRLREPYWRTTRESEDT